MDTEMRVSTECWHWRRKFHRCSCQKSSLQPFNHESGALPLSDPGSPICTLYFACVFRDDLNHLFCVCFQRVVPTRQSICSSGPCQRSARLTSCSSMMENPTAALFWPHSAVTACHTLSPHAQDM